MSKENERDESGRNSLARLVKPKIHEQKQVKAYSCTADHKKIGNDKRFVVARSDQSGINSNTRKGVTTEGRRKVVEI